MTEGDLKQDKSFNVFINEDGVLNIVFFEIKDSSEDKVIQMKSIRSSVVELLDKGDENGYDVMVDLSLVENHLSLFSSKARKIGVSLVSSKQLKKWAIVSNAKIMGVMALFVAKTAGKKDVKWFLDKDSATKWLKK